MSGHLISIAAVATERFWQIAVLTAAGAISLASPAEASRYYWSEYDPGFHARPVRAAATAAAAGAPPSGQENRGAEGVGQAAGTAGHRDLDRQANPEDLRRQRTFRGNADLHRHEGPSDADGRLQRHSKTQAAPFQHLQQRADAVHATDHLVRNCHARRRSAGLPGVARLHPHADGFRRTDVELDQDGRAGHRHARRNYPGQNFASPARRTQGRAAAAHGRQRADPDAPPAAKADKGAAAEPIVKPTISEASLELRSTVGHNGDARPATGENSAAKRDQTRTADASSSIPATSAVTMSDASSSAGTVRAGGPADSPKADAKPEAEPAAAKPDQTASSDDQPVETKPSEAATADRRKGQGSLHPRAQSPTTASPRRPMPALPLPM